MPRKKVNRVSESRTVVITAIIASVATIIAAVIGALPALISNVSPTPTSSVILPTHTPTPQNTTVTPTPTKTIPPSLFPDILKNDSVIQILTTVIASLATIFVAVIVTFGRFLTVRKSSTSTSTSPPATRLQKLIDDLSKSSSEADTLIREITDDLKKRQIAMTELQSQNADLAAQEAELRKRIDLLKDMPIEVAEYFQKINEQNLQTVDKRSSRRDFQFFVLGIVVSTIIAIILRIIGLG